MKHKLDNEYIKEDPHLAIENNFNSKEALSIHFIETVNHEQEYVIDDKNLKQLQTELGIDKMESQEEFQRGRATIEGTVSLWNLQCSS